VRLVRHVIQVLDLGMLPVELHNDVPPLGHSKASDLIVSVFLFVDPCES